jgi:protein-disulfide isomerase/uncharacterized membrane protein
MPTFVTVGPPALREKPQRPLARPLAVPGRGIAVLAALGILDALYLCYVHLFLSGACTAGKACGSVLESEYGSALGIPLAAWGLAVFSALLLAAARRHLGWVRLFAVAGSLPGPFLIYIQAARLHTWCPFCLASTGLLFASAVLCLRGGRASVDLARAPGYLAALFLPIALVMGAERGIAARDVRRALAPEAPMATIAEEPIPLDRVPEVGRLEWDIYRARLDYVRQEVLRREAAAQRTTVKDLVFKNVDSKVMVPEEEIVAKYKEEGGPGGEIPHDRRMQIAAKMILERRPAVEAAYLASLFEKYRVKIGLVPPAAREQVPLNPRGGPVKGPEDAPLEIVLFSDFNCPLCARVQQWLKTLDVPCRVAFRNLPLGPPGPPAFAAYAAHEQGKFWEFADVLFTHRTEVSSEKLLEYAAKAGLDLAKFKECLASDRPRKAVEADMAEARELGIQSTPTLFLNGVHFVGVPDDRLVHAILEREAPK